MEQYDNRATVSGNVEETFEVRCNDMGLIAIGIWIYLIVCILAWISENR